MTYKDIMEKIAKMTSEQQACSPTVLLMDSDEVISVMDFVGNWNMEIPLTGTEGEMLGVDQVDGVLDKDHPYFIIAF